MQQPAQPVRPRHPSTQYGSVPTKECIFEDTGSGHLYPDWLEAASIFATRILASKTYYMACIVMILVNTFLVIWMAAGNTESVWWFVLLEVLVTAVIVGEVAFRMISEGSGYWRSGWNVFDFIVMLLCVAAFMVYLVDDASGTDDAADETATSVVLVGRYVAQSLRLFVLLRFTKHLREQNVSSDHNVLFDQVDLSSYDAQSRAHGHTQVSDTSKFQDETQPDSEVHL